MKLYGTQKTSPYVKHSRNIQKFQNSTTEFWFIKEFLNGQSSTIQHWQFCKNKKHNTSILHYTIFRLVEVNTMTICIQ